jgi:general secretion pathway protein J
LSRQSSGGMTLIEVMVALALLSLLSIGMVTSFRLGEHAYRQITAAATSDRDQLSAQRFVRQIIESTSPLQQYAQARVTVFGLEGTVSQLSVTAPMPQGGGGAGNYRYEFLESSDERGLKSLIVRWSLDRSATPSRTSVATEEALHQEVLLNNIGSVDWAYLASPEPNSFNVAAAERWSSSWTGNRKPPVLVRLRVTFPPGDRRRWPELIAGPRVTDDPNCQFDVVSQACRET